MDMRIPFDCDLQSTTMQEGCPAIMHYRCPVSPMGNNTKNGMKTIPKAKIDQAWAKAAKSL